MQTSSVVQRSSLLWLRVVLAGPVASDVCGGREEE